MNVFICTNIERCFYETIPLGSVRLVYSRTSLPAMLIAVVVGKLKRRALTAPAKQICRRSLIRQKKPKPEKLQTWDVRRNHFDAYSQDSSNFQAEYYWCGTDSKGMKGKGKGLPVRSCN